MLHAHPQIAVPPETRHVIELYDRRHEFGDLGTATGWRCHGGGCRHRTPCSATSGSVQP